MCGHSGRSAMGAGGGSSRRSERASVQVLLVHGYEQYALQQHGAVCALGCAGRGVLGIRLCIAVGETGSGGGHRHSKDAEGCPSGSRRRQCVSQTTVQQDHRIDRRADWCVVLYRARQRAGSRVWPGVRIFDGVALQLHRWLRRYALRDTRQLAGSGSGAR